jgi:pyruvate dehydrogenase E1 component beta subunit
MPHSGLNGVKEAIPTEEYTVPLGKADIKREGKDVTVVTYSAMVQKSLAAAETLRQEGINVEIIDLRSLVPLDIEAIVKSVKKTGRLLIAHEAGKRGGVAGEIAFRFIEAAPDLLKTMKSPVKRLAAPNIALPPQAYLENQIVPQTADVISAVKEMV